MELSTFIKANRVEIDQFINAVNPGFDIDDNERKLWIINDQDLFNWAENEGVTL